MKRIKAFALFAIANFAMAGMSFAQSNGVQATVPFDFTVANKVLPSGTYTITKKTSSIIAIESRDKAVTIMSLVHADGHQAASGGKLVFHKYGGQYFLSEVLSNQAAMNVELPTSKTEKKVRLQQATLNPSSDTLVATR